jgi:hypothetical protein
MQQNTHEFIEKVKELAERYDSKVSVEKEGESVGTFWKLRIDNAGVEVKITAGRCIITDEEGNSKQFKKKPGSDEWKQESLGHIEALLK